jgi:hypothetical protein
VLVKANALISNLTPGEEARALALADIALHNSPPNNPLPAGERAKKEHRRLMEQLERAAKKARRMKRVA